MNERVQFLTTVACVFLVAAIVIGLGAIRQNDLEDAGKWRNFQKGISTVPCEWPGTQDVQSSER
jgi:hypothetical protein